MAPTLRIKHGKIYCDLPISEEASKIKIDNHDLVMGVDVGLNSMLEVAFTQLGSDGVLRTNGRSSWFRVTRLQEKNYSRARKAQLLNARIQHLDKLISNEYIQAKRERLDDERLAHWEKIKNLNKEMAHLGSRWLLDTAKARGCQIIAVEDLSTMESKGMGKKLNRKLSMLIRGKLIEYLKEKAEREGFEIRIVKAAYTSARCSGCGRNSRFVKHRQSNQLGYNFLKCSCGRHLNRDHNAAINISARALSSNNFNNKTCVRIARTKRKLRLTPRALVSPMTVRRQRAPREGQASTRPDQRSVVQSSTRWNYHHKSNSLPGVSITTPTRDYALLR